MASFTRADVLDALVHRTYDVVVIGGGMTGTGVAVDAASRGLSVALVEAGDFASGTSSKSSKMVHGGLRYLQQKEFRLVYENLRERQRLLENAPYLVRPLPFLIPLFAKNGVVSAAVVKGYATALRLYDLTGGWRIGQRYQRITKEQALARLPTLGTENLVTGFLYMDARGDDARVALTLARTATDWGADTVNYVRATNIAVGDGAPTQVTCHDAVGDSTFVIRTRSVVNATGVWADEVFSMADHHSSHRITPAKGVHVSVPHDRLPASVAAVLNVPGDRRSIFVVPFEDAPFTYIGTTDTAYDGDLDTPYCESDDVAYLLNAVNASTSSDLTIDDVRAVWAGLRPLLAPREGESLSERTADLSRRHQVTDSGHGVVHITGGKWTTYRQMAEDTMDVVSSFLQAAASSRTKHLRLHAVSDWRPASDLETHLYRRYGDDTRAIIDMIDADQTLANAPIPGQPYVDAEFLYAARHEMATSIEDLLCRRTRAHLHDSRAALGAAAHIARVVASTLSWDEARIESEVATYRALVEDEFAHAGIAL